MKFTRILQKNIANLADMQYIFSNLIKNFIKRYLAISFWNTDTIETINTNSAQDYNVQLVAIF